MSKYWRSGSSVAARAALWRVGDGGRRLALSSEAELITTLAHVLQKHAEAFLASVFYQFVLLLLVAGEWRFESSRDPVEAQPGQPDLPSRVLHRRRSEAVRETDGWLMGACQVTAFRLRWVNKGCRAVAALPALPAMPAWRLTPRPADSAE